MSKLVTAPRPAPWGVLPPGRLRILGLNDIIINGALTIDQKDLTGQGNLLPEFALNDLNDQTGLSWLNLHQNLTFTNAITHFLPKDRQWWLGQFGYTIVNVPQDARVLGLEIDGEPMYLQTIAPGVNPKILFGPGQSLAGAIGFNSNGFLPVVQSIRYKVVVQASNLPNPTDGVNIQMWIWEALNQTLNVQAPPPIPQAQLSKENNEQWQ